MRVWNLKNRGRLKRKEQSRTIGVFGSMEGVGVTHTLLTLATYLSGYRGYQVAYVEFGEQSPVHCLREAAGIEGNRDSFSLRGIEFYPQTSDRVWLQLQHMSYDYILIDYGVFCTDQMEQYARCHVILLVGSLCEWKRKAFEQLFETEEFYSNSWICFAPLSSDYDRRKMKQEYGINVWGVPCILDPFILEKCVISFWNQFSL